MRSFRDTALLTIACTAIAVPTAAACRNTTPPPKPVPCPTTPEPTTPEPTSPEPTSTATSAGGATAQDSRKARFGGKSSRGKQGHRLTHGRGGTKPPTCVPPTTPPATTPPTTPPATTPVEPTTPEPTTPVEEPTGPTDV